MSALRNTGTHLLARIQALERRLGAASSNLPLHGQADCASSNAPSELAVSADVEDDLLNITARGGSAAEFEPEHAPIEHDAVDGMGSIALSDEGEHRPYHGPSANLVLVRELTIALAEVNKMVHTGSRMVSRRAIPKIGRSIRPTILDSLSFGRVGGARAGMSVQDLPPNSEASNLLAEYFKTVGLFFPCIHQDTFIAKYNDFRRDGTRNARRTWLALLYMIFASTHEIESYASPTDSTMEVSRRYRQTAVSLIMPEAITYSDLETVQMLCLMTCHLQGSPDSAQAWTFHVLSVKAAMQIGLHAPGGSEDLSLLQREMRKRTWFWCIHNDALLSAHLGRPPIIQKSLTTMTLPLDITDAFPTTRQSRSVMAASVTYFTALIGLSGIITDVLAQLYSNNGSPLGTRSMADVLRLVFDFSWKLSQWHQSVPEELQPTENGKHQPTSQALITIRRFQTGLALRYYVALNLVYRSALLCFIHFRPGHTDDNLQLAVLRDFGFPFVKNCIRTCRQGISLAKAIVVEPYQEQRLWGAWWMTNFLAFNTSIMELGILMIAKREIFVDLFAAEVLSSIHTDLKDVGHVFRRLNDSNQIVSRCHGCLRELLALFDSTYPRQPGGDSESPGSPGHDERQRNENHPAQAANVSDFNDAAHNFPWADMDLFTESLGAGFSGPELDFLNGL
ncbi:hypothetical protein LTR84_012332 [Exophiala bonariae]|uniref:Xylanolytic transcriptional activator regulatory domain-containing protein n=1 Tax=Exophiala bonariae TaxID=1690606 RepID=A0AAV9NJK7_9EURO|nr:hypothetical protein LTR84_012332 [Exophiala bonariae]